MANKAYYGIAGTMDVRKILAANLAALQSHHRDLKSTPAVERASADLGPDRKISKTVIQQVQKGATPFNLDDLQTLAEIFGLDAWQLLVPQVDPEHPPVLRTIGAAEEETYRRMREARKALDEILGSST